MDTVRESLAEKFDCPLYAALSVLGGRWTPLILWHLLEDGPHRFLALQRKLSGVSRKVLAAQLKELQGAGLVERRAFEGAIPHTEYRATAYAASTRPALDALCAWGEMHLSREPDAATSPGRAEQERHPAIP